MEKYSSNIVEASLAGIREVIMWLGFTRGHIRIKWLGRSLIRSN